MNYDGRNLRFTIYDLRFTIARSAYGIVEKSGSRAVSCVSQSSNLQIHKFSNFKIDFHFYLLVFSFSLFRVNLPAQLNQCLFQRFFRPDEIVFPPELLIIRPQLISKKFIQPGSFP
jgi:hypothetical protein